MRSVKIKFRLAHFQFANLRFFCNMGGENGENLEENICGRGVGNMLGGRLLVGVHLLGDARRASLRDKGALLSLNFHLLSLNFHP